MRSEWSVLLRTPQQRLIWTTPQLLPPMGNVDPHLTNGYLGSQESVPKRHLDRFSRFCAVYQCDRHTDKQTDMQTTHLMHCVYAMRPSKRTCVCVFHGAVLRARHTGWSEKRLRYLTERYVLRGRFLMWH